MKKLTRDSLEALEKKTPETDKNYIKVGMSTCGIAAGADVVYQTFADEAGKRNLPVKLLKCGCLGMCFAEPLVEVAVEGLPTILYGRVTKETAVKILDKHVTGKMVVQDHVFEGILRR